ncbi:ABC transporter substrate-binding protein [Nocardioides sp.]|uniref:ABC transporter substrate-binding protein n=1 Tax=Nocardioides sp. TaxID=35761 RepID=UPI003D0BBCC2
MATAFSRRRLLQGAGLVGTAGLLNLGVGACSTAAEKRISFLNWQDYVDPALLTRFTKATGLAVGYETYESNDELEKRLLSAAVTRKGGRKTTSFDLVVPSENLFTTLMEGDLLQKFDSAVVTSALLDNLEPELRSVGGDYAVPWATGTTGIGYDTTVFTEPPTWEVFLDATYAGKMSLLNEQREAFAAALFSLGEDINTTDPAVIDAAETQLERFLVQAELNSSTYLDDLADGKLVVAQGFNTDVLQAAVRNRDLAFTVPEQGGTTWVDLLCIPVDAPNPEGANKMIAFYLDPANSADNAAFNLVDTGNVAARESVPAEVLADPAVFPTAAVAATLVPIKDLDSTATDLYGQAWERLTKN